VWVVGTAGGSVELSVTVLTNKQRDMRRRGNYERRRVAFLPASNLETNKLHFKQNLSNVVLNTLLDLGCTHYSDTGMITLSVHWTF